MSTVGIGRCHTLIKLPNSSLSLSLLLARSLTHTQRHTHSQLTLGLQIHTHNMLCSAYTPLRIVNKIFCANKFNHWLSLYSSRCVSVFGSWLYWSDCITINPHRKCCAAIGLNCQPIGLIEMWAMFKNVYLLLFTKQNTRKCASTHTHSNTHTHNVCMKSHVCMSWWRRSLEWTSR